MPKKLKNGRNCLGAGGGDGHEAEEELEGDSIYGGGLLGTYWLAVMPGGRRSPGTRW